MVFIRNSHIVKFSNRFIPFFDTFIEHKNGFSFLYIIQADEEKKSRKSC